LVQVDRKFAAERRNALRSAPQHRKGAQQQQPRTAPQTKAVTHQKKRWNSVWKDSKRENKYFAIPETWKVLEDIEFTRLKGLQYNVYEPTEICSTGYLCDYEKAHDRVLSKSAIRLNQGSLKLSKVSVKKDPILRKIIQEEDVKIVTNERVLSTLMSIPYSVLPWDIQITRKPNTLVLDAREGSILDYTLFCESGLETLDFDPEPFNSPNALIEEATNVNEWFLQQSLSTAKKSTLEENLLFEDEHIPVCYRYNKYKLGEIDMVVRSEVHGLTSFQGKEAQVKIHCLNEVDPKVNGIDYRKKADIQRGSLLASERLGNAKQMAKWAFEAVVAGVDLVKLGYV
jgi:hypothetical protein